MQADAYAGFNGLYVAGRKPGPIIEAACWAHGRRKLFELAELQKAPIAIEAVRRIDELFAIEREINGLSPDQRLAVRRQRSKPLVDDLERWMRQERRKLSSKNAARQGHGLQPEAMDGPDALPRRWPHLHVQQCRRARRARHRHRPEATGPSLAPIAADGVPQLSTR